jgi:hypothetical protein
MSHAETQAFFEGYRDAFNRLDGDAVADFWHSASGITDTPSGSGHAHLLWWPEDAPMRANHRALCDVYRNAGYGRADFELEQHLPLGPNHAFAHLRWTITHADGHLLQQFHTGYQLMRTAQGPKVLLAVAHAEDLAALRGSPGAGGAGAAGVAH